MYFKVYSCGVCVLDRNRPFPSYLVPLFHNESVQNLSSENEFDWHENEHQGGTHFLMVSHFWHGDKANSEMAYMNAPGYLSHATYMSSLYPGLLTCPLLPPPQASHIFFLAQERLGDWERTKGHERELVARGVRAQGFCIWSALWLCGSKVAGPIIYRLHRMKSGNSLFAQYHNTPLLPPQKNLHRHCFRFPLGHLHVPGEIANNDYAKFLGGKSGVLWDFVQVENVTICVTFYVTCCNTVELECGLTSNVVSYFAVDAVHMVDIKVNLGLYCSCRSLKS